MDGHGTKGHVLVEDMRTRMTHNFPCSTSIDDVESEISNTIRKAHSDALVALAKVTRISGTTLLASIISDSDSIVSVASIGDSRAIIGRRIGTGWNLAGSTIEHTINVVEEKERILRFGGRIDDEGNVFNGPVVSCSPIKLRCVGHLAKSFYLFQGVSMTRALGDSVLARVGILTEPEMTRIEVGYDDYFLLLASDGLWDVMRSDEAVGILGELLVKLKPQAAVEELIN